MRFIHTSDLHLGFSLFEASLIEEQENVLNQLISALTDIKPDALLISGDIYDRALPPYEAIELFDDFLNRVVINLKIPTVIISGNHDSPKRMSFGSEIFKTQKLFIRTELKDIEKPIEFKDEWGSVFVYTLPYYPLEFLRDYLSNQSIETASNAINLILEKICSNFKLGSRNILMAHLFVRGGKASESERSLSVGGTDMIDSEIFKKFDYVALGHLHCQQKISENIYYSGSICKYSFSESNHEKGFLLVEINKNGEAKVEKIPVKLKREVRVIEGSIDEIIAKAKDDPRKDDYICVRLADTVVFEPIGRLKEYYPNILRIEKQKHYDFQKNKDLSEEIRKALDPLNLFKSFVKDVRGKELNSDEEKIIKAVISEAINNTNLGGEL